MHAGFWCALLSDLGIGIPNGIKEYKERPDFMFLRDGQKNVEALFESLAILLPEQVVQEHAHGVQSERFRPPEFFVDALGIESRGLPHFQLVDGRGWNVVATNQPRLFLIPVIRRLFRPTSGLRLRTNRGKP